MLFQLCPESGILEQLADACNHIVDLSNFCCRQPALNHIRQQGWVSVTVALWVDPATVNKGGNQVAVHWYSKVLVEDNSQK